MTNYSRSSPRLPRICGTHAELPLTKGRVSKIDLEDVSWVSKNNWHIAVRGYAACRRQVDGRSKIILLHREIVIRSGQTIPEGSYVDHINGDTLDNRRCNLRVATPSQNSANRHHETRRRRRDPGHRGVCFAPELHKSKPWMAYISRNYKRHHLGYFSTPEEAASAHREAALRLSEGFSNFHND